MGVSTNRATWILDLQDRVSKPLAGIGRAANAAEGSMLSLSQKTASFRENLRGMADEIPGMSRALKLLRNPLVLGAAAFVGIAAGMDKAAKAAAEFNHNFRDIENLNFDKTRKQLDMVKAMVTETARLRGFDLIKTNTAFYDVQSITGMFGGDVAKFVNNAGTFAQVNKADMNAWISGTAKAMANYGFGNDQLDRYNASAYATMKAGYLTLDQFAKVAPVFAGAAAAAGQDFDTANKIFTLFTLSTKSVDEASTLVKSLFTDYSKASTIKGFKSAGIDMFDSSGRIKQADQLLLELDKKFKALGNNDRAISALRNQFTGSEGLIAFINRAAEATGAFKGTLASFAASAYDPAQAMENFKNDTIEMNEVLKNNLHTSLVQFGRDLLPVKNLFLEISVAALDAFGAIVRNRDEWTAKYTLALGEEFSNVDVSKMNDAEYNSLRRQLMSRRSAAEKDRDIAHSLSWVPLQGYRIREREAAGKVAAITDYLNTLAEQRNGVGVLASPAAAAAGAEAGGVTDSATGADIISTLGGGAQQKTVNVHIGSLIEEQSISTQTLRESMPDIQRMVEEAIIRAVGGAEQILATS